jgi:hypothetical protein
MNVNLDMLRPSMLHRITGHVDSSNSVTVDNSGLLNGTMQLGEQLSEPNRFSHSVCSRAILGLSRRAKKRNMLL